ncbi:MAG TPA: hypothetical protein PLJ27_03040 [Polyangiaceae bacterium]|jgi:hypothetical protein|nr:MAG: hypothetical protein BWY17_04885 [Deltaproteobacteria bacterium ADurb.Bin207]HNZ22578.1 hypothetical protein [Polyangiaceae bacterium]HOD25581.1 hypothetical protein [Polyangiaceae bacterium]HOE51473.1 hypothetical protein [Polyangiaceae bacterium]HOH00117.1 hypothetical protein [Polyangiaceae bacterium]
MEHIEYYQAIQESTQKTVSSPYIAIMLRMILDTVISTPQVGEFLVVIAGEMGREALQSVLAFRTANPFASATSSRPWPMT